MEIKLSKEVLKYYNKADQKTKKKMDSAFQKILNGEGERAKTYNRHISFNNCYRLKLEHYRVVYEKQNNNIYIKQFATKNEMKFRKSGFK